MKTLANGRDAMENVAVRFRFHAILLSMQYFSRIVILPFLFATAYAETTPLTKSIADETETTITCELTQPLPQSHVPLNKNAKAAKTTYHYKLWLPKGYGADSTKRWPCMFITSAGGNAFMATMQSWLKNNGFVVVMLVEAKNGPWEPIIGNFLAAHDDVIKRVRIAERKKYATGHSGGARASSIFVQLRPGFCGLILQAAGPFPDAAGKYNIAGLMRNPQLRIAMTMGIADPNRAEADRMKKLFTSQRLAVFEFNGGHTWAPPDVFEKAMAWLDGKSGGSKSN